MERKNKTTIVSCGNRTGIKGTLGVVFVLLISSFASTANSQPQARITFHPQKVHLNRFLHVTLELVWSGEADVYDIPRPDLSALPDFEVAEQSISASRKGEGNTLTFQLVLKPLKEGTYNLGLMKVSHFEKGKDVAAPVSLPEAVVQVQPPEALGFGAKAGLAAGAAIAACAGGFFFVIRAKARSRKWREREQEEDVSLREGFLADLKKARRLLIDGEPGRYVEALVGLMESDTLRPHVQRIDEARALAESLKYGGQAASPDQLKWAEKLVKEAIEKAFPHRLEDEIE
jgi:hypothetical protein